MGGRVKGIEKLTSVRLAEILTERAVVSSEVITDALYAQDKNGEAFTQILVTGGHITEWDLAKLVTEHFNLPFLMAANYQISDEAKKRLPKEVLFQHTIVPLDVFGDIVCIAMPVMISFDDMAKIQREHNCDLFPYVGLISENKKVLTDMHKDYPMWLEAEQKRREEALRKRNTGGPKANDGDWMSIFDAGDMATKDSTTKDSTTKDPVAKEPAKKKVEPAKPATATPSGGALKPSAPPKTSAQQTPPPAAPPTA
jgi:cell division ATPase FtsA